LWQNFVPLILILPFVLFLSTLIDAVAVLLSFWLEKAIFVRLIIQKMYFVFCILYFDDCFFLFLFILNGFRL
jgi:hypothetical protein